MKIMGHLLHSLGVQGIGIVSLKIAQHLLSLFTDVSWAGELGWQDRTRQGCRYQKLVPVITIIPSVYLRIKIL